MAERPHFRREQVLEGPAGPVFVWACRTLDAVGQGEHWRTAHCAWVLAGRLGAARVEWTDTAVTIDPIAFFPHQDRTLQ
jgi:hypothetical protein